MRISDWSSDVCSSDLVGHRNVPSRLAADASALYARNLYNFISVFWDKDAKTLNWVDDDEIVKGVRLTKDGAVVHPMLGAAQRSEERRVGKGWVSTCDSRVSPLH